MKKNLFMLVAILACIRCSEYSLAKSADEAILQNCKKRKKTSERKSFLVVDRGISWQFCEGKQRKE